MGQLYAGSEKLGILFEQWAECAGNWNKSTLYVQMRESRTNRKRGSRKWLTRAQVIEKWGEKVGNEICDLKLSDPESCRTQVKNHPDHPTSEAGHTLRDLKLAALLGDAAVPGMGFRERGDGGRFRSGVPFPGNR